MQVLGGDVVGDDHHLAGNHHGHEDQRPKLLFQGEVKVHEGVGCQAGEHDLCADGHHAHHGGVFQVVQQGDLAEYLDVVFDGGVLRDETQRRRAQLGVGLEGEEQADDHGGDEQQTDQHLQRIGTAAPQLTFLFAGHH